MEKFTCVFKESEVHVAGKSGLTRAYERAKTEGSWSGASGRPMPTCEMQAHDRAWTNGSASGASVYVSFPEDREFKSWRRPDKKFHFPCEGLAEGHSPTDYHPGMAEMLAASLSEAGPSWACARASVRAGAQGWRGCHVAILH